MVTKADLEKYPQLKSQGVSENMHYDFFYLEQQPLPTETALSADEQVKSKVVKKIPTAETKKVDKKK